MTLRLTALATALVISIAGCSSVATLDDTNANTSGGPAGDATSTPTPAPVPSPESTVEPDASAPKAKVSVACDSAVVVKALKKAGLEFDGAPKPNREPEPGTERALAVDNKGTLCLWDVGDDYVGAWWTTVDSAAWNAAEKIITEDGGAITEIPGIDADVAYFTFEEAGTKGPNSSWTLDALHGSTWIRLTSTSWVTPEEGVQAFGAALKIAKLRG